MNGICGGHWDTNEFLHQHHTWHRTRQTQTFSAWLWLIERSKPNWLVVDLPLWKILEFVSWGYDIPNWMDSHKFHGSSHHQPANSKWLAGYSWRQLNNRRWHHWFTSPAYDVVLSVWIRRIFTINKEPLHSSSTRSQLKNSGTASEWQNSGYYIYISIYILYISIILHKFLHNFDHSNHHRDIDWQSLAGHDIKFG